MVFALVGSLTVAVLSSAIAWRLYRLERLRSLARVSALAAAIGDDAQDATEEFAWEEPALVKDEAPGLFSQAHQPARSSGALVTAAVTMGAGSLIVVMVAKLVGGERTAPRMLGP